MEGNRFRAGDTRHQPKLSGTREKATFPTHYVYLPVRMNHFSTAGNVSRSHRRSRRTRPCSCSPSASCNTAARVFGQSSLFLDTNS